MVKSKLSVNCDTYMIENAREHHINFSQTLEEALRVKLAFITKDTSDISFKQAQRELAQEERKMAKCQEKVNAIRLVIEKYQKEKDEREKVVLEREKEKIRATKECGICGEDISNLESKYAAEDGKNLCKGCFLSQ